MDIQNCRGRKGKETKTEQVNIRVSERLKAWLDRQDISPTLLFYEACREVGYKEK